MLEIKDLEKKLRIYNLTKLSKDSGVPYSTLRNIAIGHGSRAKYEHVKKLIEYFGDTND